MTLNRRDFVATVGLSLVTGAAARAAAANEAAAVPAVDGNSDWAAVRAQFDLAPDWMHFSQFYIVSHPKPVRDAIYRFRDMLDKNPFTTVEHGMGFDVFLGQDSQERSRIPIACSARPQPTSAASRKRWRSRTARPRGSPSSTRG